MKTKSTVFLIISSILVSGTALALNWTNITGSWISPEGHRWDIVQNGNDIMMTHGGQRLRGRFSQKIGSKFEINARKDLYKKGCNIVITAEMSGEKVSSGLAMTSCSIGITYLSGCKPSSQASERDCSGLWK